MFVDGGTREPGTWTAVAAEQERERIAARAEIRVIPGWETEIAAWVTHRDLARLADGLRRRITSEAVAGFPAGDPLGFDIPVGYAFAKEAEI
ncbi:MAG: hypothetical protein GWM90_21050, partial [Gemmatimonadetes bacterium]|nr:hypothetical protein [Gemmatimonadota bacterium]NIQ56559.1 hypothetical protein [Gemmatimonadota bacterium]NIX46478.1 hypothetical protein [Gemmatimonadota bacterium]